MKFMSLLKEKIRILEIYILYKILMEFFSQINSSFFLITMFYRMFINKSELYP